MRSIPSSPHQTGFCECEVKNIGIRLITRSVCAVLSAVYHRIEIGCFFQGFGGLNRTAVLTSNACLTSEGSKLQREGNQLGTHLHQSTFESGTSYAPWHYYGPYLGTYPRSTSLDVFRQVSQLPPPPLEYLIVSVYFFSPSVPFFYFPLSCFHSQTF